MAARFGATPIHQYATKIRYVVACLLCLNAMLIAALVIMPFHDNVQGSQYSQTAPLATSKNDRIDLLVAARRIEQGSMLEDNMFEERSFSETMIPMGAIRARDRMQLIGKYSAKLILANSLVSMADIATNRPTSDLQIPSGFRAVTIVVDPRTGVEGFAKADARVDVIFTFTQSGRQKVSTLVPFAKVLSLNGATSGKTTSIAAGTTVTLLVSEKDAKRVELARNLGSLSLVLVGDTEGAPAAEADSPMDIDDLVHSKPTSDAKSPQIIVDGTASAIDPNSGTNVDYILPKGGKWMRQTKANS